MTVNPYEISRQFPIGRILKLSELANQRIIFFSMMLESIRLIPKILNENIEMNGGKLENEEIPAIVDKLIDDKPLEGMVSLLLGEWWNNPTSYAKATLNEGCLRRLIWAVIYADMYKSYHVSREVWSKLNVSLVVKTETHEEGILIKGYDFDENDFGRQGMKMDVCPDRPPASLLEGLTEEEDDEEEK